MKTRYLVCIACREAKNVLEMGNSVLQREDELLYENIYTYICIFSSKECCWTGMFDFEYSADSSTMKAWR